MRGYILLSAKISDSKDFIKDIARQSHMLSTWQMNVLAHHERMSYTPVCNMDEVDRSTDSSDAMSYKSWFKREYKEVADRLSDVKWKIIRHISYRQIL